MNLLWPKIYDYATAKSAVNNAGGAALFIAGITGTAAIFAVLLSHPVMGIGG
jgi:hypothetical protein